MHVGMLPTTAPAAWRAAPPRIPTGVNKSVLATLIWSLASLLVAFFGVWHCWTTAYNNRIECDVERCVLSSTLPDVATYEILREDLNDVKVVRLNLRNELIEAAESLSLKRQRMLGSTLQFTFRDKTTQMGKSILFPPFDMGGGSRMVSAKQAKRKLDEYLADTIKKLPLEIDSGKRVTVLGILCVVLGIFSVVCSCFVGIWADAKKPVRRGPGSVIRVKRRD